MHACISVCMRACVYACSVCLCVHVCNVRSVCAHVRARVCVSVIHRCNGIIELTDNFQFIP